MFITDLEADGRQTLDTVRVSIPGIVDGGLLPLHYFSWRRCLKTFTLKV